MRKCIYAAAVIGEEGGDEMVVMARKRSSAGEVEEGGVVALVAAAAGDKAGDDDFLSPAPHVSPISSTTPPLSVTAAVALPNSARSVPPLSFLFPALLYCYHKLPP